MFGEAETPPPIAFACIGDRHNALLIDEAARLGNCSHIAPSGRRERCCRRRRMQDRSAIAKGRGQSRSNQVHDASLHGNQGRQQLRVLIKEARGYPPGKEVVALENRHERIAIGDRPM